MQRVPVRTIDQRATVVSKPNGPTAAILLCDHLPGSTAIHALIVCPRRSAHHILPGCRRLSRQTSKSPNPPSLRGWWSHQPSQRTYPPCHERPRGAGNTRKNLRWCATKGTGLYGQGVRETLTIEGKASFDRVNLQPTSKCVASST